MTSDEQTLIERPNVFDLMPSHAADQFERHTYSAWRPRCGSKVNHRHLTAAMIDSRDFHAAKKRADREVLLAFGLKVAGTPLAGQCRTTKVLPHEVRFVSRHYLTGR